jgi:hypothetical protein
MRMAPPTSAAPMLRADRGHGAVVALSVIAAVLLLLWAPAHLSLPLGRDQAIISRVTQIMLDGGWPYVDAWDHKGPAAYLLYAPAIALLGQAESTLYWADLILLGALFFAFRAIATRLHLPLAGPLGVVLLILCVRNGHWSFAQPDTWVGYIALAAAAMLLSPRRGTRPLTLLAVGCAIGFAAMVKPIFAGFLVLPLVAVATQPEGRRSAIALAGAGLGFGAAVLAIAMPFVLAGHWETLWESYVVFNLGGHLSRNWNDLGEVLLIFFGTLLMPRMHLGMTAILIMAGFGFRVVLRRDRRVALVLASGWVVGFCGVAVQSKAFPYHFMAMHGFTAAFAAAFVADRVAALIEMSARIRSDAAARRRHAMLTGMLVGCAVVAMVPHALLTFEWWSLQAGRGSRAAFDARMCQTDYCPWRLRELGTLLRAETRPDERIFVWGFDSAIYLHADRPAASRFGFSYPLIGGTPQWRDRVRAELIATLTGAPPRVIVVQTNDYIRLMASRPSSDHLAEFPELAGLIGSRYVLAHDLGDFQVHRRRD